MYRKKLLRSLRKYDDISAIICYTWTNDRGSVIMSYYGYHRTSTVEQHLDRGVAAINDYCGKNGIILDEMFCDRQTGKNFDRPDYKVMKRIAKKPGDVIILSELDRLGRNKEDTLKELRHFKDLGVRVMILEIPTTLIDYASLDDSMASMIMETVNNMLIEMYAAFAHAEMQKREKRQAEGIRSKKERGEWADYGRPRAIERERFAAEYKRVVEGELRPFECMRALGLTKATYYRYKKEFKG